MSLLSWPPRPEAIFWVVTGAFSVWSLYRAKQTLDEVREVTRVTKEEKPVDFFGQNTEDAISLDTLRELYDSPNWNIRQASVKILIERAIRDDNLGFLLRNAASKDMQIREEAMTILAYLAINSSYHSLRLPRIYRVIVDALVSYIPESANRAHEPYTDWKLRSKTENCALTVLLHILIARPNSMKQWLKAGLVTRWLANYPFGGTKAKDFNQKRKIQLRNKLVDAIKESETDDRDLECIFQELFTDRTAMGQLRRYSLLGNTSSRYENTSFFDFGSSRRDEYDTETEESQAARRRRRREAVVIGDAGQPISQENIFNADAQDTDMNSGMQDHT